MVFFDFFYYRYYKLKITVYVLLPWEITIRKNLSKKLCTKCNVNYTYYDMGYIVYNPWFFPKNGKRVFDQCSSSAEGRLGFPLDEYIEEKQFHLYPEENLQDSAQLDHSTNTKTCFSAYP